MPATRKKIDRDQVKSGLELAIRLLGPAAAKALKEHAEEEEDAKLKAVYRGATELLTWIGEHPKETADGIEALYDWILQIIQKARDRK